MNALFINLYHRINLKNGFEKIKCFEIKTLCNMNITQWIMSSFNDTIKLLFIIINVNVSLCFYVCFAERYVEKCHSYQNM